MIPTTVIPTTQSAIGIAFLASPRAAIALVSILVAADLFCVAHQVYSGDVRACLALVAFMAAVSLSGGDLKSLGLLPSPVQRWTPWIGTSLKITVAVAICMVVGFGSWTALGHDLNFPVASPSQVWPRFVQMCFLAPVIEETLYRFVACGFVAAVLGHKLTIAINGVLFGYLHVVYGNPSPENIVGGFFLAWSFLKSETFLMPVLLHSLGNLLILVCQVAGWYILRGPS